MSHMIGSQPSENPASRICAQAVSVTRAHDARNRSHSNGPAALADSICCWTGAQDAATIDSPLVSQVCWFSCRGSSKCQRMIEQVWTVEGSSRRGTAVERPMGRR